MICCDTTPQLNDPAPAVYFWKTTWELDSVERQFLKQYRIRKIYLRYFDLVVNPDGNVVPNATIYFNDSVPAGIEIIPTVFITENCLRHGIDTLAQRLVKRVRQINETHHVGNVKQLQLDCDWTQKSITQYYSFLKAVGDALKPHGWQLSATIRLHQLSMPPPPVDYGVLMVYNTGDPRQYSDKNPILDIDDVKPFVRNLKSYKLPLAAAYPNFGWDLLFDHTAFKAILYGEDLNDSTLYFKTDDNKHLVVQGRYIYQSRGGTAIHLNVGDTVFSKIPDSPTIVAVHDLLAGQRHDINRQVVLYSLDSKNINNYTHAHYEKIYHP